MGLPLSGFETSLFVVSLSIWAALLFGGFVFGTAHAENRHRMPTWTRLASSFVLVISGWMWFAITQGTQVDNFAAWVAIGMTLGFIGDIFMAQIFKVQPYVLYGIGAFGLGHIAYIIGLGRVSFVHNLSFPNWGIMAIWWLIALIGWYVIVYRGAKKPSFLHLAALPYAILLSSTAGAATSLAMMNSSFILIPIGAALFLLSDLILAAELFNNLKFPLIGDVVWLTYGPAQMLIVYGVLLFTIVTGI